MSAQFGPGEGGNYAELEPQGPQPQAKPDNDPTEYLPVMRHHLHEALWVINMAQGYVGAHDLAASYRDGLTMPKSSPLSRSLDRSHTTLAAYLGLLDDEEADDGQEPVSEDE